MKSFQIFTKIVIAIIIILIALILYYSFYAHPPIPKHSDETRSFEEVLESKKLVVALNTNFIDFYIHNGRPMGFQLEILEAFAKEHELELEVIVENDPDKATELLQNRTCDIVTNSNENTIEKSLIIDYCEQIRQTKLVLVQRKPASWRELSTKQINDSLILDLNEINNKNIYVKKGSVNIKLIEYSIHNFTNAVNIIEIDSLEVEDIIIKVANNELDMTICDYHFANLIGKCYDNLHIDTEVSVTKNISWETRTESNSLTDTLDAWISAFKDSEAYSKIYKRYLRKNRNICAERDLYFSKQNNKLSDYDDFFKKYSKLIDWDWRLLASLSYQESRFNPNAVSNRGAFGIMQLMPFIYDKFADKSKINNTENQIYTCAMLIAALDEKLPPEITDSSTRIKYILCAYNAGYGHMQDAFNLAKKYDEDINSWENVSYYLSNLYQAKYYNDPVVKNGPLFGYNSVKFANAVTHRFKLYKAIVPK